MTLNEAERKWGFQFPGSIGDIQNIESGQAVVVAGNTVAIPWPPLSAFEIHSAHDVATDWELNPGFVPIMGNFHDLVCLDYSASGDPDVVIIDDSRNHLARFNSIEQFIDSLVPLLEEDLDTNEVIEKESWLDF